MYRRSLTQNFASFQLVSKMSRKLNMLSLNQSKSDWILSFLIH